MARRLMYHPESDSLFEEYDDTREFEGLDECLNVTGRKEYEDQWMDEQREKWIKEKNGDKAFDFSKKLIQRLLSSDIIHSCYNCGNFDPHLDRCNKWNTTPPARVIVFSCGKDGWIADIPF